MAQQTIPARNEVPIEHTWDATSVFPNDAAWEAEMRAFAEWIPSLERFRGKLGESPAVLLEWLQALETLEDRIGCLFTYAMLFHTVDTADQAVAARYNQARSLYARAHSATAFGEPEMLAIAPETLDQWTSADGDLALYRHYFDQLQQRRAHVRSAEVEELLGQVAEPFGTARSIHGILANADLKFAPAVDSAGNTAEVGQGTIGALLTDADRATRKSAWESYADAFLNYQNTSATCLAAGIQQNVALTRARRYELALDRALSEGYIPPEVFHNLIATFQRHLPVWHRYWEIRRRALGYDALHVYDIKAPLTAAMPHVPLEQSVEWISEGMRPLGDDYVAIMRRGLLEERWVDVYPNKGKRMGAFSGGSRTTHPFILMSYNDDLFSLSTLAHELGHSLHSYFTRENQPPVYNNYGLFAAEVASNFNQALVRAHLLQTQSDPDFQIAVIEEAMANFHRYFFVMPTLARFELEIHQRVERGEPLTAASLNALMADLFREGFGPGVEVDADRVGITWAQFSSHLYSNFYVYQYATGISGAHALAEGILSGAPGAVERYRGFLSAGGSLYPLDALRLAGVDLASPEPVEQTFAVLSRMVDRLAELLGQSSADTSSP